MSKKYKNFIIIILKDVDKNMLKIYCKYCKKKLLFLNGKLKKNEKKRALYKKKKKFTSTRGVL